MNAVVLQELCWKYFRSYISLERRGLLCSFAVARTFADFPEVLREIFRLSSLYSVLLCPASPGLPQSVGGTFSFFSRKRLCFGSYAGRTSGHIFQLRAMRAILRLQSRTRWMYALRSNPGILATPGGRGVLGKGTFSTGKETGVKRFSSFRSRSCPP